MLNDNFNTQGITFPVDVITEKEATNFREKLVGHLNHIDWKLTPVTRHKPHITLPWARELGEHPNVLKAIRGILGEDILLWYSVLFVKAANSKAYVPWHQDATYWALERHNEGLTVWLALNEVNQSNGSMSYIPGSHKIYDNLEHKIVSDPHNVLARGQTLTSEIDTRNEQWVKLKPGQASIHHNMILHRSGPNQANEPRLGIAFRYISPSNRPTTLRWMKRSGVLVSGKDDHHFFTADPDPRKDSPSRCMLAHRVSAAKAVLHTIAGDSSRSVFKKVRESFPTLRANLARR